MANVAARAKALMERIAIILNRLTSCSIAYPTRFVRTARPSDDERSAQRDHALTPAKEGHHWIKIVA
jgi:hypothetical protein